MPKNIAMLFDGTWNKPAEFRQDSGSQYDTNVRRFYNSIDTFADDGREQVAAYDFGVGTEWLNAVRGARSAGAVPIALWGVRRVSFHRVRRS
jgi:uncharacterized protein (DUF2235 family)